MSETLSDFGQAVEASAASRLFRASGKIGDTLALALQIATASRPQEGTSAYTEALEAHVQAQATLIEAFREELAAKDDLLDAKHEVIAALFAEASEENRERLDALAESMAMMRRLGIHFREIADTARNIRDAVCLLGHSSMATTGRYTHARPSESSRKYLAV